MATLASPVVTAKALLREVPCTAAEFDFDNQTEIFVIEDVLDDARYHASRYIQRAIGAAHYALAATRAEHRPTDIDGGAIYDAEMALAAVHLLRKKLRIIGAAPQAIVSTLADPDLIEREIDRYAEEFQTLIAPYVQEGEDSTRGFIWSLVGSGVDETYGDYGAGDYSDSDFGTLTGQY